jgi:tRNA threonylcarbamoyladenosine biosynthesis protein TsaB
MNVLAFDTSGAACSVAVADVSRGDPGVARSREVVRGHAEALMPMVAGVMAQAGLRFDALDLIAVTVGPGLFTGLRVGIAAARGLALATGVPCIGVSTFAAMAATCRRNSGSADDETLAICIDSRRADMFVQLFDRGTTALSAASAVPAAALAQVLPAGPLTVAGDAAGPAQRALVAAGRAVRLLPVRSVCPLALARLAAAAWQTGTALPPQPLYLREPDTGPEAGAAAACRSA